MLLVYLRVLDQLEAIGLVILGVKNDFLRYWEGSFFFEYLIGKHDTFAPVLFEIFQLKKFKPAGLTRVETCFLKSIVCTLHRKRCK